jgi:hypothetical protein
MGKVKPVSMGIISNVPNKTEKGGLTFIIPCSFLLGKKSKWRVF